MYSNTHNVAHNGIQMHYALVTLSVWFISHIPEAEGQETDITYVHITLESGIDQ